MEILWLICQLIPLKSKILLSNCCGKEFDLLVYFLQNQNVILPKTQIFDRLWGFDSDTTISVVEVYVSKSP